MATTHLVRAEAAYDDAQQIRNGQFAALVNRVPFVIEELNERIQKAIKEGKMFVTLKQDEVTSVPDTSPELFIDYLKFQGYTVFNNQQGDLALYFFDPTK